MSAPDLTLVASFAVLADELHFGRAAIRLSIATPVLSQRIARLERQLGVRLAVRPARTVRLTPAGEVFAHSARTALAEVDHAVAAAQAALRSERHTVRVGWTADIELIARPVMRGARLGDAGYDLSYCGLVETELIRGLLDHSIDVAVMWHSYPNLDPALCVEGLLDVEAGIAMRSDHVLAGRDAVSVEDMADQTIVVFPRQAAVHIWDTLVSIHRPHGDPEPLRTVPLENHGGTDAMLWSVQQEGGYCPTTRTVFDKVGPPSLRYARLDPTVTTVLSLVFRRTRRTLVAPMLDLLRSTLSGTAALPAGLTHHD